MYRAKWMLSHSSINRSGVTVVEMLTVMGVVGLLMALFIPAVARARESARQVSCTNNLRQAGLAIASFAEVYGAFPTGRQKRASGQALLLPYLEQPDIYKQITGGRIGDFPNVPALCCPSDPEIWKKNSAGAGDSSYLFCRGTRFPPGNSLGPTNGFVSSRLVHTRAADIVDGLSNTVAMSERLAIPHEIDYAISPSSPDAVRYLWWTEQRFFLTGEEEKAAVQALEHRVTVSPAYLTSLCYSYLPRLHYDHILPPNVPGSHNGPDDWDSTKYDFVSLVPASSLHTGGVNSLLADGSVRFHSESIDLAVWLAVGTRNGGEQN